MDQPNNRPNDKEKIIKQLIKNIYLVRSKMLEQLKPRICKEITKTDGLLRPNMIGSLIKQLTKQTIKNNCLTSQE